MRYTAIALDYDGTIAHDGGVPPHVMDGLRRLKASGRKLILVTGRELEELLGVFPDIGVFDLAVVENGALMYYPQNGERRELGEPAPQAFIDRLHASGIPLSVGHTIVATVRPHETVVLQAIADLGLEQQVIFNKGAVMVLPPGCNKATGLKAALAELGLSARNVVAAGDGENDHALLEMAEYSAATANAVPTLKDAADRVTSQVRGDGVLEIIEGLLRSDLADMPPRRPRRTLCLGRDPDGHEVVLPRRRASILVTGEDGLPARFGRALLTRLCKSGYQFCVLDTRGDYIDFKPAVVFGTRENAPAPAEVLTALDQPDVQSVVCLAAVPARDRPAFVEKLLWPLKGLRERTGRPHWILVDDAHDVLPAATRAEDAPGAAAENTIYVTTSPSALAPDVLGSVFGIVACGANANAMFDAFIKATGDAHPPMPKRAQRSNEALVWFRGSEQSVALIDIAELQSPPQPSDTRPREKSEEVGQLLRRA